MDLFEKIFQACAHRYQKIRQTKKQNAFPSYTVYLKDIKAQLLILARALCAQNIEIAEAEREGGLSRAIFYLPTFFYFASNEEENLFFYFFRIIYLSEQFLLKQGGCPTQDKQEILNSLFLKYPLLKNRFQSLCDGVPEEEHYWFYGRKMEDQNSLQTKISSPSELSQKMNQIKTELQSKAKEEVEILEYQKKKSEDYTLGHNFEKIETLEEFKGNWRDCDGEDDLQQQAQALEELNLKQLIRVNEPVHSLLQADLFLPGTLCESKEVLSSFSYSYDEWNYQKRSYQKDYCKVYVEDFLEENLIFYLKTMKDYAPTLREMKRKYASFYHEWQMSKREVEGADIDLDALLESRADYFAGHAMSERIYVHSRRSLRDLALIVLVDRSLSTDAYTQNQRVLDIEKVSICLFSEFLEGEGDLFEVDAFSSQTRNHCDYLHLKKFSETLSESKSRFGALEAQGYTRIGPALRHATYLLSLVQSKQKWVVLLSDGKPNDYDRYEGRYGVEDVRQAVREMTQQGVHLYALAVEEKAKYYLPQMLGANNFKILPKAQDLPQALGHFYTRLKSH